MINIVNLLWIIPTCIIVGGLILAFFIGATGNSREFEAYQEGILEGKRMMCKRIDLPLAQTLGELFDRDFDSDFNKFKEITGGIIYGSGENGQLSMIFIDNVEELGEYYQNKLVEVIDSGNYQRPIIEAEV